tara:strand:+ start:3001 stop:3111 length:111 start_codon:yes stop_codon:yes gene_type:complete
MKKQKSEGYVLYQEARRSSVWRGISHDFKLGVGNII